MPEVYDRRIRRQYYTVEKNGESDSIALGTGLGAWHLVATLDPSTQGLPFYLESFLIYMDTIGGIKSGFAAATVVDLMATVENMEGVEEIIPGVPGNISVTLVAGQNECLIAKDLYFTRPVRFYIKPSTDSTAKVIAKYDYIVRKIQN